MSDLGRGVFGDFDTDMDDPIRKFQSELEELKDKTEALRPLIRAIDDAIARCDNKIGRVVHLSNPRVPGILLTTVVKRLDELIPFFRELAKEGIKVPKQEEAIQDKKLMDFLPTRRYKLGENIELMVMLPLTENEGGACRMVQTGVKEVPLYEVVCDEQERIGE